MSAILEILIDGKPLDLMKGEEDRFYITKQIHDLNDLETRNGDFSRGITLPLSRRNESVLGNQIPSDLFHSGNPAAFIDSEVKMKGVPVIGDAELLITSQSVTNNTVEATVFGGATKFFSQLRDEPISRLDLHFLDIPWNLTEVQLIAGNTSGICYADALWISNQSYRAALVKGIDQGVSGVRWSDINNSGFYIYLHTLLDKIFSNLQDLTVDTSKLDAAYFQYAIAVPYDGIFEGEGVPSVYSQVSADNYTQFADVDYTKMIFPNVNFNDSLIWDAVNNEYVIAQAGDYEASIIISGLIGQYSVTNNRETTYGFFVNDVLMNVSVIGDQEAPILPAYNGFNDLGFTSSYTLAVGDRVSMKIQTGSGKEPKLLGVFGTFTVKLIGGGTQGFLDVASWLPEISQRDLVRQVFSLQNILAIEDNKTVTLEYFETIRTEIPMTKEVQTNQKISYTGFLPSYGQTNIFKYSTNDRVERLDANTSFLMNAKNLPENVIKIELQLSATDISEIQFNIPRLVNPNYDIEYQFVSDNKVTLSAGSDIYTTAERNDIEVGDLIHYNTAGTNYIRRIINVATDFSGQMDLAAVDPQNSVDFGLTKFSLIGQQIHLARIQVNTALSYDIRDGGNKATVATNAGTWPRFDNPVLWDNLKAEYYRLLTDSLFQPLVVVANFKIGVIDYLTLTGLKTLYVPSIDQYFYVNKITQWKYNQSVRLELIKMNI